MAKNLSDASPDDAPAGNPQHNVGDLKKMIRECASSMLDIRSERRELNERAGDIRKRLKDAGIQTAAFDYAVRMTEMEQEARDSYLDTLSLAFETLGISEQLDWVKSLADDQAAEKAAAE